MNRALWILSLVLVSTVCQGQGVLSAVPDTGKAQHPDPFPRRCAFENPAETLLRCQAGDVINVPVESASAICNMREQIVPYRNEQGKSWVLCVARGELRTEE